MEMKMYMDGEFNIPQILNILSCATKDTYIYLQGEKM